MKQLLLGILLIASAFIGKAQSIVNNTFCDITVTQLCFDPFSLPPCKMTTGRTAVLKPGDKVPTPTPCVAPMETAFQVCWTGTICTPTPCTIVDANSPIGSCSGAPYTNTMGLCDFCSLHSGVGTVTYDPLNNDLIVNP